MVHVHAYVTTSNGATSEQMQAQCPSRKGACRAHNVQHVTGQEDIGAFGVQIAGHMIVFDALRTQLLGKCKCDKPRLTTSKLTRYQAQVHT